MNVRIRSPLTFSSSLRLHLYLFDSTPQGVEILTSSCLRTFFLLTYVPISPLHCIFFFLMEQSDAPHRGGRASGHALGRDRNHVDQAECTSSIALHRDAAPPQNAEPPGIDPVQFTQQSLASIAQLTPNQFTAAHHEFIPYQTPRYDGRGGYETAEEWILRVQETLLLSQSPTEHYTELATTLLDRNARHWWTSQQSQHLGGAPNTRWEWFIVMFRARFISEKQLSALIRHFETLTQGGMTARRYGETFICLSCYAPDLVTHPQCRRDRFILGLNLTLASMVDPYQSVSIEFLMDKAEFLEGLLLPRVHARNAV